MSSATPGPWLMDDDDDCHEEGRWIFGPSDEWVGSAAEGTYYTYDPTERLAGVPLSKDTVDANARLIAAAPDLLAALEHHQGCVYCMDGRRCGDFTRLQDAAIAKAKGDI
jgi:hypothetical protein